MVRKKSDVTQTLWALCSDKPPSAFDDKALAKKLCKELKCLTIDQNTLRTLQECHAYSDIAAKLSGTPIYDVCVRIKVHSALQPKKVSVFKPIGEPLIYDFS